MSEQNLKDLFDGAEQEGAISPEAREVIKINDMGAQIQEGLGLTPENIDIKSSEVMIVAMLVDDSSSIDYSNNTQAIIDGYNVVIKSLYESKQRDSILVYAIAMNSGVLCPCQPVSEGVDISQQYSPIGRTPLFDEAIVTLATILAKCKQFNDSGVSCRTATLFMTDGCDVGSQAKSPEVKKIIDDMLLSENHIIAGMGIDDGCTDFKEVFSDMGIRSEWILTPGNTQSEIRKAFQVFSQSAVRASQNAGSFSQTANEGFCG